MSARTPRFTIDLLDDPDALAEAVLPLLADDGEPASTRRLAKLELDVVASRLDGEAREVLVHALGLLDRAFEEIATEIVRSVLRDVRRAERRSKRSGLGDAPELTADGAGGSEQLRHALDQVVHGDPDLRRMTRRVLRAQERVRARVDDETWRSFLRWETAVVDRDADAQEAIARWAYAEGSRAACEATGTPGDRG